MCRVSRPGGVRGPAQAPPGTGWTPGAGTGRQAGGKGSCASAGPRVPEEGWGGRAGRGGRLEDARLSESSQSTLTR